MLRSLKDLERYTVTATDGDLGSVSNFLLDDERWTVRYLVVEPGLFHDGRRVLVSPIFFRQPEWATRCFHLALTKDKIRNSPSVNVDKPVSRQHERDYFRYYGYPYYWGYSGLWGMGNYPGLLAPGMSRPRTARKCRAMSTCGAPRRSLDMTSMEATGRSVPSRISSSTTRHGEFNTW